MASLPPAYFDALYSGDPDPWRFRTSAYEAAKYAATIAVLPRPRYASGLEIGCSIGVFTALLAQRCDALVATDVAEAALAAARTRNRNHRHVRFERRQFPDDVPAGVFDLIVFAEMLYYLGPAALVKAAAVAASLAQPGADIILVHWLGETPDYPLTGTAAAEGFIAAIAPEAEHVAHRATPQYRIDHLRCRG